MKPRRNHDRLAVAALSACALAGAVLLVPALAASTAEASPACDGSNPDQVRLRVDVSGMRSTKGNITITLYPDDAKHFLDGAYKVARQELPVIQPVTRACFVLPKPGDYAVALFHDANDNHHFDTTWLGLPDEGYGFSRNPTLRFGPPHLRDVRIPVHAGDNQVSVSIKHY